jgi:hypothetical protein
MILLSASSTSLANNPFNVLIAVLTALIEVKSVMLKADIPSLQGSAEGVSGTSYGNGLCKL